MIKCLIYSKSQTLLTLLTFFYKLKLLNTMHIHDVFHLKLFYSAVNNFLFDQKNEFLKLIIINNENE